MSGVPHAILFMWVGEGVEVGPEAGLRPLPPPPLPTPTHNHKLACDSKD